LSAKALRDKWQKRHTNREGKIVAEEAQGVAEVHILWTSEGMSCDGDSVSITAAMQPSIEDVVLGVIPGLPK
jgi:hydrogenase small subunit